MIRRPGLALVLPLCLGLAACASESDPGSEDEGTTGGSTSQGDSSAATEASGSEDTSSSSDETNGDTTSGGDGDTSSGESSGDGDGDGDGPIQTDVRNYIFGHSLILHSDTANVPRWLDELSGASAYDYAMSGQYGFADTHAGNLPPIAQWGVPGVQSAWDSDYGESFGDANFNTVLFTEANFRQYYPPTESDPDGFLPESSVASTLTVFDWVDMAEPGVRYVIYENWPDMAGYTNADFQGSYPSAEELAAYHAYTRGEFHNWWIDYQDAMLEQRPELNVRMVPVGSVLASLLSDELDFVPAAVLYEDDAPHGTPTLYFLAGLTTYMALYGERPPLDYTVPDDVDQTVAELYPELVDLIWQQLQDFDDDQGVSRVF